MRKMVRDLRRTYQALGTGEKKFYPSERDARRKMGKSIVLKSDIEAGTVLTADLLGFKSPGDGIPPSELDHVLGKTTVQALKTDDIVLWQHLK